MYQDDKKKIKKITLIVKIILAILVVCLLVKLAFIFIESRKGINTFDSNLRKLDAFSQKYLNEVKKDIKVGKNKKYYLNEIKNTEDLFDKEDKCSLEKSYILITRLDNEYQIKSYLSCKEQNDYKTSFIKVESVTTKEKTSKKTTTKRTNTTKKTTKKVTTKKIKQVTKKQYTISFNVNGGSYINSVKVTAGSKLNNLETPIRTGYTFIGWYSNGVKYNISNPIYRDTVLVAKWIKNK